MSNLTKKEKKFILKQAKEITKMDNETLTDLINKIRKHPYGSDKYTKARKSISKKIAEKYPEQYVLCTYNKFDGLEREAYLSRLGEVTEFDTVDAFHPKQTFFESNKFKFVAREEAEYNFAWKQISVFGFITDGAQYILLQKKEDKAFTLIGGHVDYSVDAYQCSQQEIIRMGMQRELDEEIVHKNTLYVPEKPIVLVNTFNKFHDLFHMALVYKIEVDDADKLFDSLRTGEPEKHDIVKVNSKTALLELPNLHHWIKTIDKYL
jgi:predicted NUDIX family phosphoesterase